MVTMRAAAAQATSSTQSRMSESVVAAHLKTVAVRLTASTASLPNDESMPRRAAVSLKASGEVDAKSPM